MYCNELCRRSASASYYRVLCSKDFGWLYDVDRTDKPDKGKAVDKGKVVEGALCLRVIALCIQEGCHHLDQLKIAGLTSQYLGKIPRECHSPPT